MVTGAQLRAARALLKWSAQDSANRAGLNRRTVERLEAEDGTPATRVQTLEALKAVYESAGVEFIGMPEEGPGVRLWKDRA